MNFSYEEIFTEFGQYDTFVDLTFHYNSDAYRKYKPSIMGTFKYTLEERLNLQSSVSNIEIPRTNNYIKFEPSSLETLDEEQEIELDKIGIQNSDISVISSVNLPRQNRFNLKGVKEIQNSINVKFDSSISESFKLELYTFNLRLKTGGKLIEEEENKYWGFQFHYNNDQIPNEIRKKYTNPITGEIIDAVKFYYLKAKYFSSEYCDTPVMDDELINLIQKRGKIKFQLLKDELKKSSEKLNNIGVKYNDSLKVIIKLCIDFEDEVLLPYKFPIWWDFERFLHIYIRHVKETKVGERFADKTIFQYKFRDIRRIIIAVLKSKYEEIQKHFIDNPNEPFKRLGKRSVYYDGNYYRIEIEPNGRLISFHPYNDNENTDNEE